MSKEGSMAADILEGIFCEECGQYIGEPVGHPRKCRDCQPRPARKKKRAKVREAGL
jgi:hypothetical protein